MFTTNNLDQIIFPPFQNSHWLLTTLYELQALCGSDSCLSSLCIPTSLCLKFSAPVSMHWSSPNRTSLWLPQSLVLNSFLWLKPWPTVHLTHSLNLFRSLSNTTSWESLSLTTQSGTPFPWWSFSLPLTSLVFLHDTGYVGGHHCQCLQCRWTWSRPSISPHCLHQCPAKTRVSINILILRN